MCGIFGLNIEIMPAGVSYQAILSHRGPENCGEYSDECVLVGHNRLSFNDLTTAGNQPFFSNDSRYVSATNGEIYNYRTIKDVLSKRGHRIPSSSDCGIINPGCTEWGVVELLRKIDGMFATAIYDREEKSIFLARDRVGIKPLYYYYDGVNFAWASEIKFLTKLFQCQPDKYSIIDFLTYRYIPAPRTGYQNIFQLEAGYILNYNFKNKKLEINKYWDIDDAHCVGQNFTELLEESVKAQSISDVRPGIILSGGVDSSTLILASTNQGYFPNCYTMEMGGTNVTEFSNAEKITNKFGLNHVKRKFTNSVSPDTLLNIFDQPFYDTSAFPCLELFKFVSVSEKTVLSGDGADELFGGYKYYQRDRNRKIQIINSLISSSVSKVIRKTRLYKLTKSNQIQLALIYGYDFLEYFVNANFSLTDTNSLANIKETFEVEKDYDHLHNLRRYWKKYTNNHQLALRHLDFKTSLPDNMLRKVDITSMQYSLEVRLPFLSNNLINYAFGNQSYLKSPYFENKKIIRSYLDANDVGFVNAQKKIGFSVKSGNTPPSRLNAAKLQIEQFYQSNG